MKSISVGEIIQAFAGELRLSLTDNNTSLTVQVNSNTIKHLMQRYSERLYIYEDDGQNVTRHFYDDWDMFVELHQKNFDDIYTAMLVKYNPIDNYKMTEDGTDTTSSTDTTTRTGSDTTTNGGTITTEDTTATTTTNTGTVKDDGSGTTINAVAGYDSNNLVDRDKTTSTTTNTRTDNTTQTATNSGTITQTDNKTSTLSHDTTDSTTTSSNTTHTLTRSGNIGVTTSQQMLTSEFDIRVKHNVLYYIVELFISQYTIWG